MKKIILYTLCLLSAVSSYAQKVDRSKAPAPKVAPQIELGKYQLFTLDNGLKVIVVENHKLPRVSYTINLGVDPTLEGSHAGFVQMAGDLLGSGTQKRTKNDINQQVDFIGANLSTSANSVSVSGLVKHSDRLLDLLSDVTLNSTFPQDELDKLKKQTLSGLVSEKTDPNAISDKIGNIVKYGKDHPYGEFPTEESVNAITREDLISYYNSNFTPGSAYLIIVGDITVENAQAQAVKYFGNWKGGVSAKRRYNMPKAPKENTPVFVAMPGAVQSVIDITYPIDLLPGSKDAIVASMLNNVLGGSGFQTRLMQNLREDKAYTYGAYSAIAPDEVVGYFSAGASVRNEVTDSAIVQFLYELDRLVKEPIADSTLQTVKNIMTGNFARSLERPQTIANFAYNIEHYNLPEDYYQSYLTKLNAITAADIQAAAAKYLKPSNAYITVVGNKEVMEKLRVFSPSKQILTYNPDGTPYKELKPLPAGVTAETILLGYINAIGGEKKLAKVKAYEQTGSMKMGPMSLNVTTRMKGQKQFSMVINMQGQDVMKQVYDGTNVAVYQMGAKQPSDESMADNLKMQADLLAELHLDRYGMTAKATGIDIVNGKEAYVVEFTRKDGTSTEYYDVATGLRVKSVTVTLPTTEDAAVSTTETTYVEYLTVGDGLKFPSKMKQVADGQQFSMEVSAVNLKPKFPKDAFKIK
jgi:zinc protease